MHFKKKLQLMFFLLLSIFPSIVFAYSSYIIPGGENIGIKMNTKYVSVVGFYKVNDSYIGEDAGFKVGDLLLKINDQEFSSIDEMIHLVDKYKETDNIKVSLIRDGKTITTNLSLEVDESGIYKTGLYVKDQINGIGTLTYIDPETKIYGALGHEIADKNTLKKVEIKDGEIYSSLITGIRSSKDGEPGEKQAKIDYNDVYGDILANRKSGIFGTFRDQFPIKDAIEVGKPEDVKLGKAIIRTVIADDLVEEFEIKILEIDYNNPTKNILFEIIDSKLLEKTGGVVAGMSGSPIIQNNKIIGGVTHVIVNDTEKGYGIFITTMLEEGEN
ncbi:MAG: PDZ domain-containing protein [Firmicutes bacterium]|nr:PDZ domain-containing protein [Bacillota bacterium]